MPAITAIVPCAGKGRRFGAPYPKELHCIAPGHTLLDRALAPLVHLATTGYELRVVAVIGADRHYTVERLRRYSSRFQLLMVFQSQLEDGLTGAVGDALPLCEGSVLLVLPDQFFDWTEKRNPLVYSCGLLVEVPFVVLAARCTDLRLLRREGALRVDEGAQAPTVLAAEEKPVRPSYFNAVWAVLARIMHCGLAGVA